MVWIEEYKRKLVSAEEAVKVVKSGDRVVIPISVTLEDLHEALGARKDELRGVEILQGAAGVFYPWYQPAYEEAFITNCATYAGPIPRQLIWDRKADFTPAAYSFAHKDVDEGRPGVIESDVLMIELSPPDKHGFCSFGDAIFEKKDYVKRAKKVVAEVNDHLIRTYGDNFVHVSEIDYFVEATPHDPTPEELEQVYAAIPPPNREIIRGLFEELRSPGYAIWKARDIWPIFPSDYLARTILAAGEIPAHCYGIAHYLSPLINDGDTIQIGAGNTSNPLLKAGLFDSKHDLGLHTEAAPPGTVTLVKEGVFTGKYKTIHQGKAVATSFWPSVGWRGAEKEFLNNNPLFEMYSVSYTDNPKVCAAHDNFVAINNALYVDLTGQIASETIPGFLLWNGPGGQLDMHIGALLSKGGRAVTVLPSTAVGGSVSRIVPLLEEGIMVTIPRCYADFIVTEYGVASLMGKSQRQRAEELIVIAHPDFRAELRKEAQRLFGP